MEKCLKTQLKETVQNDNLDVFGQVKIFVEQGNLQNPTIYIASAKTSTIVCTDTLLLSGRSNMSLNANQVYQLSVRGNGYLIIKDKYAISTLMFYNTSENVDLTKCTYMESLRSLTLLKTGGDIVNLLNTNNITSLILNASGVTGNLADVNTEKIKNITHLELNSPNVICNVSAFVGGNLVNFSFNNCKNITGDISLLPNKEQHSEIKFYSSGISGALEDYVSSAISSGKTSATDFVMTGAIVQLTFGGRKQPTSGLQYPAPNYVSWDGTGKIAVKAGNYSVASCTHVFCKGYTQAEAEAAFSGMTIVRVDAE